MNKNKYVVVHSKPTPKNGLQWFYTPIGAPTKQVDNLADWISFKAYSLGIELKRVTGYMTEEESKKACCNQFIKSL